MIRFTVAVGAMLASCGAAKAEESTETGYWSATVSAASVHSRGSDDQVQASLGVTCTFDNGYAGLTISHADTGRSLGVVSAVPARSTVLTLVGGLTRSNLTLDLYLSAGLRHFDRELVGPGGTRARIDASGNSLGAGLTISRALVLGESSWLVPYVAVDHFSVDVARSVTTAAGAVAIVKETSRGTSGSLGVALQQGLGNGAQHQLVPHAALIVSSDNSAYSPGAGGQSLVNLLAIRGGGTRDIWGEIGVSTALQLAPRLSLSLGATRTLGYAGPEVLTLQGGLTISL